MKVGIVRFPGSNCDQDCYRAVREGVGTEAVFLWHKSHDLDGCDSIILPGGFSYGDHLRAGAIARFSPIMREVIAFARDGGPVLGICNGFQILCEAGLLPGALVRNDSLRFRSHPVRVRVERTDTPFTTTYREGDVLVMPIAHGEGQYVADRSVSERLEGEGRVIFRYVDSQGEATASANPNGSARNIAGICDAGRRVVGLMPHPERAASKLLGTDGLGVFQALLAHRRPDAEAPRQQAGAESRVMETHDRAGAAS
ncbi:MAG: phosphoribosylformylglycinamidine synthase subunit PurQ [Gemmatimonadota bacterium]|nr:MAG: phosphoribosylformylglycinamidine synthase subunit PurQ [Gemmatimonadota bacterium]